MPATTSSYALQGTPTPAPTGTRTRSCVHEVGVLLHLPAIDQYFERLSPNGRAPVLFFSELALQ